MSKHRGKPDSFEDVVRRVDGLWVGELDPSHIKLIEDQVISRQNGLLKRAKELEEHIRTNLENSNAADIEQDHDEFRHTEYEYARLEQARKRLYDKRQRRIVWHNLKLKLGESRAKALEELVLWLIVLVLAILLVEMIFRPVLTNRILWTLYAIDFSACMVFLYEFQLRFRLAEDKKWFMRHNWIDLLSSLPIPPILPTADLTTIARLARLMRILRLLRAVRIVALLWSGMEKLDRVADIRLMRRSLISVAVLMVFGALLVQFTEGFDLGAYPGIETTQLTTQQQNQTGLQEYDEAIWWTFNTIATGGFADLYPPQNTFTRLVTGLLILAGFVVLGVFIATLSAAYKGEDAEEIRRNQRHIHDSIQQLRVHQRALDERIDALQPPLPPDP